MGGVQSIGKTPPGFQTSERARLLCGGMPWWVAELRSWLRPNDLTDRANRPHVGERLPNSTLCCASANSRDLGRPLLLSLTKGVRQLIQVRIATVRYAIPASFFLGVLQMQGRWPSQVLIMGPPRRRHAANGGRRVH